LGRLGRSLLIGCAAILLAPALAAAAGPPLIKAYWAAQVREGGAKLEAEIDPNGLSTTYYFEYISDAAFKANPAGEKFAGAVKTLSAELSEPLTVPGEATGLSLATAYHYRPVATNSAGPAVELAGHVFTTKEAGGAFRLPDNRGWELVSPVDKSGGAIAAPEALFGGGDIQAAAVAAAETAAPILTYGSATSFGEAAGAPPASQYVSRRTGAGWSTANVSTPLDSAAYGDDPDGAPYRLFSSDLSRALLFGGLACRGGLKGCPAPNPPLPGSGAPAGYMAFYLRDGASSSFTSLLGPADVAHSSASPQAFEVAFAAASPDLSHIVLASCAALTADAAEIPAGPGRCDPKAPNLYVWSSGGLKSINGGTPAAEIAAPNGAVSADGTRIYWTAGGDLRLRDGAETDQVDGAQGGGGTFQVATPDGSVAFFSKEGHLYRFTVAAKAAADITPAGGVVGVLGASADGSTAYYQDAGGLERWRNGAITTIAPGVDATVASDYPPAAGASRVSPDGAHVAFLSKAELTGYDNTDANTHQPDTELYLYGPPAAGGTAVLACASCNPTGERAIGPSTIPGPLVNGSTHAYKPRVLSADGTRLFFDSEDALVTQDTNSLLDVYEWELGGSGDCHRSPGCVNLISSGRGREGASFLDATADGSDAFFITSESLVGADPQGSVDAYDARVGGGFAEPRQPIACLGDSCQGLPSPPDDPTPGTLVPSPGNPPLRFFGPRQKKHHGHRHRKAHRHKHGKSKHQARRR
jgi:hypothetical protein